MTEVSYGRILKRAGFVALTLLMSVGSYNVMADNGVKIEHLGTNNTLVRVTEPGKFIILPIQGVK